MERETELYLVKRIRELESENSFLKGKVVGLIDKEVNREIKPFKQEDLDKAFANSPFKTMFRGYDVEKLLYKAKAFDELVKLLHISAVGMDDKKEYRIVSPKHANEYFINMPISEETFKLFWEALTCDKRD